MTSAAHHSDEPRIPMPPLEYPALRKAVAVLVPSRLPELFEDMQQAFTWASERDSLAPVHLFHRKWGVIVAIERVPARAERFHSCERLVAQSEDPAERRAAALELAALLAEADQEISA
ncbi:hypothetical protein [Kitasatospora sp. NBC_01302]|uniref:hypothetical protein n=1 Tax=Kitasatospora sp. NBC_01302 TaxID=2903575 RepID=UPI002E16059A|nr:hypothetical protein OG294_12400 [Kitasatospora sp. NBC_01302]